MLAKYTKIGTNGGRVFKSIAENPDVGPVDSTEEEAIKSAMESYGSSLRGDISYSVERFSVKSVAERLHAGVGSLGTKRFYVLIEGETTSPDDDVILDFKAQTSPSAFLNLSQDSILATNWATASNPALRVCTAYKALGYRVDDYLGWVNLLFSLYSVRERSPYKKTFNTSKLTTVNSATKMVEQWGAILATAHARSDEDADADNISYNFDENVLDKINGQHDQFRQLVRNIIEPYAIQVMDDYNSFLSLRQTN